MSSYNVQDMNRSARRTHNMIRKAYIDLLREKQPSKITVVDIINKADISRTAFYAHYPSSLAVQEEIQSDIRNEMTRIMSENDYNNFCRSPLPVLQAVTEYYKKDIEMFKVLIQVEEFVLFKLGMVSLYVKCMLRDESIPAAVRQSPRFIAAARYIASGIEGTYISWFRGDVPISLDEMTTMLAEAIQTGTEKILESSD